MSDTKLSGRAWRYVPCPQCAEETALLLSTSEGDGACMACWQALYPGDRPTDGEVLWHGATATMVDFWLGGDD